MINIADAICSLNPTAQIIVRGDDLDTCTIEWHNDTPEISKADIQTEMDRLQTEYDALEWKRNRQAEYPTIQELVVALYDTDDKSAIEAKRTEVKAKYPKP